MYRVVASTLGPEPTREATRAAANEWWLKKEAELNGLVKKDVVAEYVDAHLDSTTEADQLIDEVMSGFVSARTVKTVTEAVERELARPAKSADRSIKANVRSFLEIVKTTVRPSTFRELKLYLESIHGQDDDVSTIDEAQVEKTYLELRKGGLSVGRQKKHWGFFRRFARYLFSTGRLDKLPRNVDMWKITVKPTTPKVPSIEMVRQVLAKLKPRLRLYALLALNCSCNNVDTASLTKSQIDLDRATLTRKRVKTSEEEGVPEVVYALWPETVELLRQHESTHPELFLTSMANTPLWVQRYEGDKVRRTDLILKQWKKAKLPISLKQFRAVSATILESHPTHSRFVQLFLGHSPRSVAQKHYSLPDQKGFAKALNWLHDRLFTCQEKKQRE
jgi:integrase